MGASLFRNRKVNSGPSVRSVLTAATLLAALVALPALAEQDPGTVLVDVNGETITVADMDALVMQAHRTGTLSHEEQPDFRLLLEKEIKDILILQDAWSMGMADEPALVEKVDRSMARRAMQTYVNDNLVLPKGADEDSVLAYFDHYYHMIQIRTLSAPTAAEAEDLRQAVLDGTDMGTLAREKSVDSKKNLDGLFPFIHWADLGTVYREQVRNLQPGDYSPVFALNQAYTFIRVEKRAPADRATLSSYKPRISAIILDRQRKAAWDAFIAQARRDVGLEEDLGALAKVIADSAVVSTGDFLKEEPGPVAELDDGSSISGTQLRKAISQQSMDNMLAPFATLFEDARRILLRDLILENLARAAGYLDKPELLAQRDQDLEDLVLQQYLAETIAPRVVFNRQEFETFYQANIERFRGPEQVRLAMLILDTKAEADDVAARLAGGGDFTRIYKDYMNTENAPPESNYISEDQLSNDIRSQLGGMEVGDTSEIITIGTGWMVFRLDGRKPGLVPALEEVEMDIRRFMYQKKFNELMDMHFATLAGQSEIVRHEDRIEAYFNPPVEDGK